MKKIAALFLALVMALSLATTAFATEVEINNPNYGEDGGTYKAYKLMNASVSGENFSYTENDKYTGVMKTALVLDATATFDDVLAKLGDEAWKGNAENVRQFADALYREIINGSLEHDKTWTGKTVSLDQGYWLIADVTDLPTQDTTYAKSLVMIDTAGDTTVEVNAKAGGVVTEKHLDDENDSLWNPTIGNEDGEDLWDIADYDIGDEVPYTITITLPDKIAEYSYYSFIIQDQVEEGLTYLEDSFQITVNNDVKTLAKVGSDGNADFLYEIVTTTDATTEKQTKQELYIYPNHGYTARDNNQAVTPGKEKGGDFLKLFSENTEHSVINNSKVVFTYKCLLNENAKVGNVGNPNEYSLKFSNNPYTDSFGETPKDVNLVLTYQVVFKKVNADQQPLAGADFDLYKFKPANVGDNPDKDAMADAGYVYSEAAESWGTYEKVESKSKNVPDIPETDDDESLQSTVFTFRGLDDGIYKLVESATPAGFNTIQPIEFSIVKSHPTTYLPDDSDHTVSIDWSDDPIKFTYDIGTGSLTADIVNRSGTELPTTGGIGTTLFYVCGGLMVAGAVVLLVTKKRMGTKE